MSIEGPTLKVRFELDALPGDDCRETAKAIATSAQSHNVRLASFRRVEVLDAEWGRKPSNWRQTGRGWGRPTLTERQRGFVHAVRVDLTADGVARYLLEIIDDLTGGRYAPETGDAS